MNNLQKISFRKSTLQFSHSFSLKEYRNLRIIDFSSTNFHYISSYLFENLKFLQKLIIENCEIKKINKNSFKILKSLKYLNMKNSIFPLKDGLFLIKSLKSIKEIYSNYFTLCCFSWKYSKNINVCQPRTSTFNSCDDLLESVFLRTVLWLSFLLSFSENLISIFFQLVFSSKKPNIFSLSLSFSDFGMSIYLLVIGIADIVFTGKYIENDYFWRNSPICSVLGVFCSSVVLNSMLSLFLITIERFQVIIFPFTHFLKDQKFCILCVLVSFAISVFISILPLLIYDVGFSCLMF